MKPSDLSVKELAAFIGVSTDTIRRTVRKGEIPATRAGTAYGFDLHQVRHQMERGGENRGHSEFPTSRCELGRS